MLAVLPPFDDPGAFQLAQPVGKHVPGGAGVSSDPGEPVHPVTDLPNGQQRPSLAQDVEGGRDRTRPDTERLVGHDDLSAVFTHQARLQLCQLPFPTDYRYSRPLVSWK
jgi:hypothetical protein